MNTTTSAGRRTWPLPWIAWLLVVALASATLVLAAGAGVASPPSYSTTNEQRVVHLQAPPPLPPGWSRGPDDAIIRHVTDDEIGELPRRTRPGGKGYPPITGREVPFGSNYLGRLIDWVRVTRGDFSGRNYVAVIFQRNPNGPYEVLVHGKYEGGPHSERDAIEWLVRHGYTVVHIHSELAPCVLSSTLCAHWLGRLFGPGSQTQSVPPTVTHNLGYPADEEIRRKSIKALRQHFDALRKQAAQVRARANQVASFFSRANEAKQKAATNNNSSSPSCPGSAQVPGNCVRHGRPTGLARALTAPPLTHGGIDFTSLELRYMREADGRNGSQIEYAFKASTLDSSDQPKPDAGIVRAQEASDAFFVWLALSPDKFWVNLNPNEPDRIVDAKFGRTDAGKVLLEADLELKRTVGQLIHPDTDLGARYWNGVRGTCFSSRQWIVPTPATVRETRDELYILDAPLSVRMETDYVQDRGTGKYRSCPHAPKETEEHNEAVYRSLVLPKVEKAVNTAPEYAALRRVYLSRVAAEWYRRRSAEVPTAFSRLIDTGKVKPWVTGSAWKPVDTFKAYVRSFTEGEFDITRTTRRGQYIEKRTYVYGGVDFSNVSYDNVARAAFHERWPGLSDTIKSGLYEASPDRRTHDAWLGGTSVADPERAAAASEPTSQATERTDNNGLPVAPIALGAGATLMLVAVVLMLRKRRQRWSSPR